MVTISKRCATPRKFHLARQGNIDLRALLSPQLANERHMTNDALREQHKVAGNPPNTEPPDIPPPTTGHPTEPPPENPPGSPNPEMPPPLREPGKPAVPDELPSRTPDEERTRGPNGPRTPNPATDVQGDDPSRGKI
jgi:hypothetical protein